MFIDLAYYTGCLGIIGIRGNILALEWDGACTDRAYADKACTDGAYIGGAYGIG